MADFSDYSKIQLKDIDVQRFGFDKEVTSSGDITFLSKKFSYKKDDEIDFMGIIKDKEADYSIYELSFKNGLSVPIIKDIIAGKMENGFISSKKYLKKETEEKIKKNVPEPLAEKYFKAESDIYKAPRYIDGKTAIKMLDDLNNKNYLNTAKSSSTHVNHTGLIELVGLSAANSIASDKSFPSVKRKRNTPHKGKQMKHNLYSIKSVDEYKKFHEEYMSITKKELFGNVDSDLIPYIIKRILPEGSVMVSPGKTMYIEIAKEDIVRDIIEKQK